MRLDKFDLNLLIALNALLEEQSVSRAADRLNLTQSAMSAALSRLRVALNDPLLTAHGRKMLITPHGRALVPQVAIAIQNLRSLISGATVFDPTRSERRFEIVASDYIAHVLIAPLLNKLKQEAPFVSFNLSLPYSNSIADLLDGKVDFFLTPEQFLCPDHPRELLFEEDHVVVGWAENPVFETGLSEEAFFASYHVAVHINGEPSFIERYLAARTERRQIDVISPSFTQVPWLLIGTERLALMHSRLADFFLKHLPLRKADSPIALPKMREMIQFHSARKEDQGVNWFLSQVLEAASSSV